MVYIHFMFLQGKEEQIAERKALRVEANNPIESKHWTSLWQFDQPDHVATQELIDELNIINAPVQLRIVRNAD